MQAEPDQNGLTLRAEAKVLLNDPDSLIKDVFDDFIAHGADVTAIERGASAAFFFGLGSMQARADGLVMTVQAADEAWLAYIKQFMAGHLVEYVRGVRPRFSWTGAGAGATRFPNLHEMTVERIVDLTPHMRRVTLSGPGLERYVTGGLHLKLFIPPAGIAKPEWPVPGEDGIAVELPPDVMPTVRTYTVRNLDIAAGTIDIDIVLHGDHGIGSHWSLNAQPGDVVGVRGPVGRPPLAADWYLLVGDETALPAIARTLESLPASSRGTAIIEVANESEQQPIAFKADIDLRWLHRNGAEPGTTSLLVDAVHAVEMPPVGTKIHAMAGVEYSAFKKIRHYWRDVLKLDKKDVLPVAYWRRGRAEGEPVPDDDDD
jgi:NADPH-dependent ferric siderophore reductase